MREATPFEIVVTDVNASDHWIATENGRLFARVWVPSNPPRDTDPPILLFHDSLGCVDLWRDFPEQLAVATERAVVAYDRLGFGSSQRVSSRRSRNS
ncbi:MAG: alpha/beta hydrolase [Geminicoccaceae bacterium]|nr:alpha/beta hydrolase [Geminicoccaceae bacterium]